MMAMMPHLAIPNFIFVVLWVFFFFFLLTSPFLSVDDFDIESTPESKCTAI